jgi:dipeptidyl aminopeptidase/acylaminoacyl peptidase
MVMLLIGVVGLLVTIYLGVCAALYRRLFVPARGEAQADFAFTPWEFQADYEEVELTTADGVNFGAWFLRQPGSRQTIIVSPGHKGQRQALLGVSVALWRKGFNVLAYSYRGMAGSERSPITMGVREVNELQAVIAYARRRVKDSRLGLLGYSMGAVVSLLGAAGEPSVEALVLDSPFSDLGTLLSERLRRAVLLPGRPFVAMLSLWLHLRAGCWISDCSPIAVLSGLEPRPLFFIHGGADAVTSVQHCRRLYDAYRGPREIWVVAGAPHTGAYYADRTLYIERVAGFFARHLGLTRPSHLRLVEDEEVS